MSCRVGIGFDVHAFALASDKPLVLGGVHFEDGTPLEGHSDADVVLHAIVDAILGAAGLGDIGTYFSDKDPRWSGVDSGVFAIHAADLVRGENMIIDNVDCTIIAEQPRINSHREAMQARLCELLDTRVNVKASTAERLGAIGRGEGIACYAVAHLSDVKS